MVTLTSTTIQHAGPIADKLFEPKDPSDHDDPDVKAVKDAYKKVDKEAEAVIKAGKSIVNFVEVIQKLTAVTTPDNSKHLTLVRRGWTSPTRCCWPGTRPPWLSSASKRRT